MRFQIKNSINRHEIRKSAALLNEEEITVLCDKASAILTNLKPGEFLFLMANLASRGTNFQNNLALIQTYLSQAQPMDLKLELENFLAQLFLKKYETENEYNAFYKVIADGHGLINQKPQTRDRENGITFFSHTPSLLAHTNPMFKMLKERTNKEIPIKIASLSENGQFKDACREVESEFIHLKGSCLTDSYSQLLDATKNQFALVWQCSPINLSYVSSLSNNLVWWSHKFHPNIANSAIRIGTDPVRSNEYQINSQNWFHFDVGFSLVEEPHCKTPFQKRAKHFGSFCREELIDHEQHWLNVKTILEMNKGLTYCYAGRSPVHRKWCETLELSEEQIKFLGWLKTPTEKIKEMVFLLDGVKLGHGQMAFEAINLKIPLISPANSAGAYVKFISRNKRHVKSQATRELIDRTIFKAPEDLVNVVDKLLDKETNEDLGEKLCGALKYEHKHLSTFEDFVRLIEGRVR